LRPGAGEFRAFAYDASLTFSQTITRAPASGYGSGRINTASTTEKMVVVAPTPSANVSVYQWESRKGTPSPVLWQRVLEVERQAVAL
jgi:hypothetical protein